MTRKRLPSITPEQCEQITGQARNHAAHTVYTTRPASTPRGYESVPVALCPGKHAYSSPAPGWTPEDPFAGLD